MNKEMLGFYFMQIQLLCWKISMRLLIPDVISC